MGMGGTGVAVLNGAETVILNPAGLTKAGDHWAIPLLPVLLTDGTLQASAESDKLLKDFNKAFTDSDEDSSKAAILFSKLIPCSVAIGCSVPFLYTGKSILDVMGTYMAVGGYSRLSGQAELLNPVSPRLSYKAHLDTTFGLTFAMPIDKESKLIPQLKELSLGYGAKHLNRIAAYDITNTREDPEINITNIINEDVSFEYYDVTGWGFDVGILGQIDSFLGPGHFGLAFYNIGSRLSGQTFLITSENRGVEGDSLIQVPTTGKIGISGENYLMKALSFGFLDRPSLVALDFDIAYPASGYVKRLHFGIEQPLNELVFWQLGLNQGYGTTGLQLRWTNYKIGLAYFSEELGREAGQQPASYWLLDAGMIF